MTYTRFEIAMIKILARHCAVTTLVPEQQPYWAIIQELKRMAQAEMPRNNTGDANSTFVYIEAGKKP